MRSKGKSLRNNAVEPVRLLLFKITDLGYQFTVKFGVLLRRRGGCEINASLVGEPLDGFVSSFTEMILPCTL